MSHRLVPSLIVACLATGTAAPAFAAEVFSREFDSAAQWQQLGNALSAARLADDLQEFSLSPSGEWMVVRPGSVQRSNGFPSVAQSYVDWYRYWGRTIDAVAVSPQGGVVVSAEDMLYVSYSGIPYRSKLFSQLDSLRDRGVTIEDVAFDPDGVGWAIAAGADSVAFSVDEQLIDVLDDAAEGDRPVRGVSMGSGGRFAVLAGDWFHLGSAESVMHSTLSAWRTAGLAYDYVVFGPGGFTTASATSMYVPLATPFDQIEQLFTVSGPGTSIDIWTAMANRGVAGVSIAIIDGDEITTRSYGYADAATSRQLTPSTPMDAASLSKAVAAMGMMTLVDEGALALGSDLTQSIVPMLDPESDFAKYLADIAGTTEAPPAGVTVGRLLNHTAGLNYNSGSSYDLMDGPDQDLAALLTGYKCSPMTGACWSGATTGMNSGATPGAQYNYSAAGYLWAQAILEGVTGQSMEQAMVDRVLAPLGMSDTTFDTAYVAANPEWFSYNHGSDGQPIKGSERQAFRWLGAGGMFTTPRDLARFLKTIDNKGESPESQFVVSSGSVNKMLTGSIANPLYGLGLRRSPCNHTVETTVPGDIWHTGRHSGSLTGRSWAIQHRMEYRPAMDQGIVVMVNGGDRNGTRYNNGNIDAARAMVNDAVAAFRTVYGWTANAECTQVPAPPAPIVPQLPGGWGLPGLP